MSRFNGPLGFGSYCFLAVAVALLAATAANAEKVTLNDGRVLDGKFFMLEGVCADPNNVAGTSKPIEVCDDDLRRTMFPKRVASKVDPAAPPRWEMFKIPQPIAEDGLPVATIGPIVRLEPFDAWGRRTFSMQTNVGVASVIQGLTTITPLWSRVESLRAAPPAKAYLWDMRIATSSIPRDLLTKILLKQIDPQNPDQRLKLVRFYMQAERFADAEFELKQTIADFPALQGLDEQARALRQLGAERVLSEVEGRHRAGQFGVAYGMLERFPAQGISGTTLQAVREKIQTYRARQQQRNATIKLFDTLLARVKDTAIRKHLEPIRAEIAAELSLSTLDRMGPFRRLADDATLLPEQKLALAISGWLLGANDAVDNVQVALSLVGTRKLVLAYLNEPLKINRDAMLQAFNSQESAAPKYVASILAHMKPPIETAPQQDPSSFAITIHGIENEPDVTYHVQLPPEYDPHVKYPTIVTLQGAGTTPEQQISWWAGDSRFPAMAPGEKKAAEAKDAKGPVAVAAADPKNAPPVPAPDPNGADDDSGPPIPDIHTMRLGQATRQGYIVIAPAWIKPHQTQYQYSAREHAAVLDSLRDACRRFSIDTDRVYLSGHSMGADAAWDIALAHPDLWAGVIPIVATSGKYVERYWPNAAKLSFYFISGELDANRTANNSHDWDRYFSQPKGWDMTLVEYRGRGHENFSDEVQRVFDWMGRKKRDFFPHDFSAVTLRTWDNFFWCLELQQLPANCIVDPAAWPPPRGTVPLKVEVKVNTANGINIQMHGAKLTVWLSPEWVNFDLPVTVTVGGTRLGTRHVIKPSVSVMLEDARSRADRLHPFWAKVE